VLVAYAGPKSPAAALREQRVVPTDRHSCVERRCLSIVSALSSLLREGGLLLTHIPYQLQSLDLLWVM
jgi:hypothetical protein